VALALGFSRSSAARFSFLLSTPIIFGACVFKYKYFVGIFQDPQAIVGVVTAAVFGFLSIKFLMKLVQNYSYALFVHYRFLFAMGVTILYFLR
jgi:undecaprenyl-diphosphatase